MESIKDFLNYPLLTLKDHNISIYHILIILVVIIATSLLMKVIHRIFKRLVTDNKMDQGSSHSIYTIVKYVIWVSVIAFCLETIGVKLTLLIASSAALLVGLGLGIQQIFHDIASGIILLFERNLKVRDIIEIENEIIGQVEEIGLRTSKILTRDNIVMIIPNSKLISENVINWSHNEALTRFRVEIGVAYGSDVKKVEQVLLKCANKHADISKIRDAFVQFRNFGESSLDFHLYFWTQESFNVEYIKSDLRFAINQAFQEENIEIPFPQRDVHIKNS